MGQDAIIGQTVLQWLFYIWSFNARVLQSWLATTLGFPVQKDSNTIKDQFYSVLIPRRTSDTGSSSASTPPRKAALVKNHNHEFKVVSNCSAPTALTRVSQQNDPNESWWEQVLLANLNPFENPSFNITAPICVYTFWRNDRLSGLDRGILAVHLPYHRQPLVSQLSPKPLPACAARSRIGNLKEKNHIDYFF